MAESTTSDAAIGTLIEVINDAGALAVETGDFLSYATVLDLRIGAASNYTAEQACQVLGALYSTMQKYPKLTYGVGWDLPALLLPFIDICEPGVGREQLLPLIKEIFTLLSVEGNHKELFLKSSELMLRLSEDMEATVIEEAIESDDGANYEGEFFEPGDFSVQAANYQASTAEEHHEARLRDFKFKMLYELMRLSLASIETEHPSRFFKSAATTLLTVASDPDCDIPSLTIHLRHLFLLGRDFAMQLDGVSEAEIGLTANLLKNYVSHAAEVTMERVSIKWADRLYYQIVNKIALCPAKSRDAAYHISLYNERINEAMSRLAQLAQSFDLELDGAWPEIVMEASKSIGASLDDEPEDILESPSTAGLLLLATQTHFDGTRRAKIPFSKIVEAITQLSDCIPHSLGVRDAMLYWILWSSVCVQPEEVRALERDVFCRYLQVTLCIANNVTRKTRHIAYSVVTKLLRLQSPGISYDFLIDTFENCPYDTVLDSAVQMLKVLLTGKLKCQIGTDQGASKEIVCNSSNPENLLVLDDKKRAQILDIVSTNFNDFIYSGEAAPLLMSWLNFLTVIDLDDDKVQELVEKLKKHVTVKGNELSANLVALINMAIESLEKARFK